jgi:hypothetical protein
MGEQNGNHAEVNGATATASRLDPSRAEEMVGRSINQTREWLARRQITAEIVNPVARLSTREWLVRASFCLFSIIVMAVVVFSALGLLSSGEAIVALAPVATLTAMILGIYLGDRQSS